MAEKKEKLLIWNWILMASELFTTLGMILAFGKYIPKQVPLYYSRPWGEDQLGKPADLLIPLGLAMLCGLAGAYLYKKMTNNKVLGKLIIVSGMVIQLMLSLGVLRIVLLVS